MNTIETFIPFPGFYCSQLESLLYFEVETLASWMVEAGEAVDVSEVMDAINDKADWPAAFENVTSAYVEAFCEVVADETGVDLALKYERLSSPRFYNFETDRALCSMPFDALVTADSGTPYTWRAAAVERRFRPRDGFIPFYSNNSDDEAWKRPLEEHDANEVETLLMGFLEFNDLTEEIEERVNSLLICRSVFYSALAAALPHNWKDALTEGAHA